MPQGQPQKPSTFTRAIRKFFLSGFVVFTFVAYVIHQRLTNPDSSLSAAPLSPSVASVQGEASGFPTATIPASSAIQANTGVSPTDTPQVLPTDTPQVPPTAVPVVQSGYKDGTFTGPVVDAFYGLVQVQATIQNGKIANVQFLQYPSDRRTSVEINSFAVPYLQQEAVQAQSYNVDIISGATLTSEAFMMSLQNALNSAKN